ncbi:MAG: YheT family hydrolase [Acinetobacter sp.]
MGSWLNTLSRGAMAVLDLAIGAEKPKLYFNPQGEFKTIFEQLPQLHRKYRPTPWLSNTHAHLLYFDLIKKRQIHLSYDQVDQLKMQDGGITGIAWYGLNAAPDAPTIVILHTITGTPESMRELVRDLHLYTGWRIALCLRRGHAGLPMPVPKMNLFGSTDDLREQLAWIQEKFPNSDLYGMGSSAGTGLLVRYLGEQAKDTPLKAAFALCPGYNTESGFKRVHPFYSMMMTKKLFQNFVEPYKDTWTKTATLSKVLQSKTLFDFEQAYFEMAGFDAYSSYNQATNPIYVFEQIEIPLLVLNAEDDPICHIRNFEPYKSIVRQMRSVAVITTKKGSHCGFYEGIKETHSWASRLAADFFLLEANKTQ